MLTYGSKVIPGEILLAGEDDVSAEQIAEPMTVMQSAQLSSRFAGGTPTSVTGIETSTHGGPPGRSRHAVAVHISDARLAEYAPINSPPKAAITGPDRLVGRPGCLI